ncbi:hypothetical protein SOPP22_17815 [Shewanella sp. OPT22]|nr:hypothetical protein SOPP22_17815 [Shewanella sp. OPT22]
MKVTAYFKHLFITSASSLLFITTFLVSAADKPIDYQLQGKVYQWYGFLDQSQYVIPDSTSVDYGEYKNADRTAGAHHILTITPEANDNGKQIIEVELEYLSKPNSGKTVVGQYVIQSLSLDLKTNKITASKTELNEFDNFESNYRSASQSNLIKAFIYEWTDHTDKLSEGKSVSTTVLLKAFGANTTFSPEESRISNAKQYLSVIAKQGYKQSRRAIKNLNIQPHEDHQTYTASFQYVWNALNHNGENELAQMGLELEIKFVDGKVHIVSYKAKYLPPVTDLGAEIRC